MSQGELCMSKKSVRDSIFDMFAEAVGNDPLFKGISEDLVNTVKKGKPSKSEIETLLRRREE
jgi:hypothetical protein